MIMSLKCINFFNNLYLFYQNITTHNSIPHRVIARTILRQQYSKSPIAIPHLVMGVQSQVFLIQLFLYLSE